MKRALVIEQINKSVGLWIKTGEIGHKRDFEYFLNQIKKSHRNIRAKKDETMQKTQQSCHEMIPPAQALKFILGITLFYTCVLVTLAQLFVTVL